MCSTEDTAGTNGINAVVEQILKHYINNVVCIDDEYVGPYVSGFSELERDLHNSLAGACEGNVRMEKYSGCPQDYNRILDKAELLVLDWELNNDDSPNFLQTLMLIAIAVKSGCSLICVYTKDVQNIQSIYRWIFAFFLDTEWTEVYNQQATLEACGMDISQYGSAIEYSFATGDSRKLEEKCSEWIEANQEAVVELKKADGETGKKELVKKLVKWLRNIYLMKNYNIQQSEEKGFKTEFLYNTVDGTMISLNINGNIIVVMGKTSTGEDARNGYMVAPSMLFKEFAKTIYISPNNIMNVIMMEYQAKLKDSLDRGSSGRFVLSNDMLAHLKKHLSAKDDSNDFWWELKDYFKQNVSYHIDTMGYGLDKRIEDYIDAIKLSEPTIEEIIRFNAYYSQNIPVSEFARLSFGDMLLVKEYVRDMEGNSEETDSYKQIKDKVLMCITAHCDCAHSNEKAKVKNSFSFVIGSKVTTKKHKTTALTNPEESENGLFDFIIIDGEPLPVKWEDYLIKVYIKKAENGFDGCQVEGIYKDCKFKMKYIGNLKQNYAQRIANRAYSFANRIGITYISKDIDLDKQKKEQKSIISEFYNSDKRYDEVISFLKG